MRAAAPLVACCIAVGMLTQGAASEGSYEQDSLGPTSPPLKNRPRGGAAATPRLVIQSGHFGGIHSVAFSFTGRLLASGGDADDLHVWDAATGRLVRTLPHHSVNVYCVAFSPDGRTLASGSSDGKVRLWEAGPTGQKICAFEHESAVAAIAFRPGGKQLATATFEGTVTLYDLGTRRALWRVKRLPSVLVVVAGFSVVTNLAFSPDGHELAVCIDPGNDFREDRGRYAAELWDAATGKKRHTMSWDADCVAFSPDGQTLACGTARDTVDVWGVVGPRTGANRTRNRLHSLAGHSDQVIDVAFSPNGRTVASCGADHTVRLWEVASGRTVAVLRGHSDIVPSVAFSPDSNTLASASLDRTVRLWDVRGDAPGGYSRVIASPSKTVQSVAFNREGTVIATGRNDTTVQLWNVTGGRVKILAGHTRGINSVVFSPDGRNVASASGDERTAYLWDVQAGRKLRALAGHSRGVNCIAFSPDGRSLASGASDRTVRLWDRSTGVVRRSLRGHSGPVISVGFSPNGRKLASGGFDRTVKLWETNSGKLIQTLAGHSGWVLSVTFSPDGRTLASASRDCTVKLWDAVSGREARTLRGHSNSVSCVAFTPDGKTLATTSYDRTIKLWEASTGKLIRTLAGHSGLVLSATFSPDGKRLVSAGKDGSVRLWTADRSARELCALYAFPDGRWAVVDPQGRYDASNAGDVEGLHWVLGDETIQLRHFKDGYYEPGLLPKLLGFNKEPLRPVPSLADLKLYPEVVLDPVPPGTRQLTIHLKNQGGGIGPVEVFLNGKLVLDDCRPPGFDPNQREAVVTVDLLLEPAAAGRENRLEVVARTARGDLQSRGERLAWMAPGTQASRPPRLFAVVAGVSTYANPDLNLYFAAKDAADMARAIALGARRLFAAERVHLTLLTTSPTASPGLPPPRPATKANFAAAFQSILREAQPEDIVVLYLAGHGVSFQGGQAQSRYAYLTQDARTTDLAGSPFLKEWAVTGEDLLEWTRKMKARKQVLILDTCAAGAAAPNLMEAMRTGADQIRAIERLKDRTGFHILMGCAADRVSLETSQFAQGLLTYALLEGMKGAALREEQFVDVSQLFQYARDRVPQLARQIHLGLQDPQVSAPKGESFDLGQLTQQDRAEIALQQPIPLLLPPSFLNRDEAADTLELTAALRRALRDRQFVALRAPEARAPASWLVEGEGLPGAIRPSGVYAVRDGVATVQLVLKRDQERVGSTEIRGPVQNRANDVPALAEKLADAIEAMLKK